jgi:FKBP-type peptidyl-prolyl cis-trans isomerase SlyD
LKIEKNAVVSFHFTLLNGEGTVLESSVGAEPLVYLHGANNIVPGLEEALTGRSSGDKFQVTLPPEKAYGMRDEKLVQRIAKDQFPDPDRLQPGMQFQLDSPKGVMILTVMQVDDSHVTIDGNPELAGETLTFNVEINDVRAASAEELEHGHVHGPGDHHH